MQISHFLVASLLPAYITADQAPLLDKAAGWLDKAKSFIPQAVPVDPVEAVASKIAEKKVVRINQQNWQRKLDPKPDVEEEWMVYVTGGNKSCHGRCGPIDKVWNDSVPFLLALPQNNLRLGILDCDKDNVLCTSWAASLPSVYHFLVPRKSSPQAKTPLHIVPLNLSASTNTEHVIHIPSSDQSKYLDVEEYTGILHPQDGLFRKTGLLLPFGYFVWGFGSTPSWLMMIVISFFSRQMMSRRMSNRHGLGGAMPPQAGAAAPAAQPVPRAAPASAGRAGGKKRR